jgi:hypothetical protein
MPSKETFLFAEPESKPNKQPDKNEPAQQMLDWLQRWTKPTITVRDVHIYGPRPLKGRKNVTAAAEVLVQNGWLAPLKGWRYDMRKWQIIRKPPIIAPKVEM